MSEPQTPPPPPMPTPEQKKSSPWKWVLIGCLAIILIGAFLMVTCTAFVAKKAKDIAGEMSDNPAMAAAEMIVRMNPELELVDKDEENGTMTVRNKETGEVATLNLDDIQEGRFSWEAEGKTVTIDPTAAAEGGEGGLITIEDESGRETVSMGTGSADQVPAWVPRYAGAEPEAPFLMTGPEGTQGTLSLETQDSLDEVENHYLEELEDSGFEVERSSFSSGDMETVMLSASGDSRSVMVSITNEGEGITRVAVNFSESN